MTIPTGDSSHRRGRNATTKTPRPTDDQLAQTGSAPSYLTSIELRCFLLTYLNDVGRAVTTSELRHRAAQSGYPAELVERIYSHLVALQRQTRVARVSARGRLVYWTAAHTDRADATTRHPGQSS